MVAAEKYKLSDLEIRMQTIKTQSKVVTEESDANIFQNVQTPNLVQPLNNYEAWFELGKLLSQFGEIYQAKNYLSEAYKHFIISNNTEQAG